MPLTPKPKVEHDQAREAAIEAVINKGLATPVDRTAEADADKDRQVVLFLPSSLLDDVDRLVKVVRPKTSRRAWLVEAIREKVEQEKIASRGLMRLKNRYGLDIYSISKRYLLN